MAANPLHQSVLEAAGHLRKAAEALKNESKVASVTGDTTGALLAEKAASVYRNLYYLHLAGQIS